MAKSIKINVIFKTLMSIVNIVFPLLTAPYVARILSIEGFTEYNKAVSIIGWFSPFAVFGVYTYGMRTISQIRNNKNEVSRLFTELFSFSSIVSFLVTVLYIILVISVPSLRENGCLYYVLSLQILFICFATDWANEAYEDYGFILIKTFFCKVLYVIFVFSFVKDENDVLLYAILTSLSFVVNNCLTFAYAKVKIKFVKISIKEIVKLLKPLFVVFLLVNSSMLYTIFDRFMLTWFGNKLDLTYYTVSQTLVVAIINVTSSILLVTIPRLSYYWGNKQYNEYYKLLKDSSSIFLAINIPCCFGLSLLSYEIIYLYAGDKYVFGQFTLLLFALRYFISSFDMILSKQVLLATGNEKYLTKIYYIGGAFNIICKIILVIIHRISPELCVITTAAADVLVIVLQILRIKKLKIDYNPFSIGNIKYIIASIVFFTIGLIAKQIFQVQTLKELFLRTFVIIFLCVIYYIFVLLITKDKLILKKFVDRGVYNEKNI